MPPTDAADEDRSTAAPQATPEVDLLVVCRANIARSPLMQVRLQFETDRRLGPGVVRWASAGTLASFGDPAAQGSRRIAARWGLSLDEHTSEGIMYSAFTSVGLNLVMSQRHVRALVSRDPQVAARTFTVPEFVTCVESLERTDSLPPFPLQPDAATARTAATRARVRSHLAAVVAAADAHRPTGRRGRRHLDVPDPITGGQRAFDALGERFEREAAVIADALFGPLPGGSSLPRGPLPG